MGRLLDLRFGEKTEEVVPSSAAHYFSRAAGFEGSPEPNQID